MNAIFYLSRKHLCFDFKFGGASELPRNIFKRIKNASQISEPCLPAAGPGNLCETLEVGLVSDVQLGWKLLHMLPNLSESSEGVLL